MTPPPALAPPSLHFLILNFSYTCGVHQCTFWCRTDAPCHLYLHLAAERPIIRRIPYIKRGADFELSSVTCFVEIDTIEQTDPGDTLEHTFIIPFPEYNHTYYWYLTGTQGGVPCKSISQIFNHSCPEPLYPPPVLACYNNYDGRWPTYFTNTSPCCEIAYSFKPVASYHLTKMRFLISTVSWLTPFNWTQAAIYTDSPSHYPAVLIGESTITDTSGMGGSPEWVYFDFPYTLLTGGVGYWFSVMQWGRPPGTSSALFCMIYKGKGGNCYWQIGGTSMNRYRYNPSAGGLCIRSASWRAGQFVPIRFYSWGSFP